MDHQAKPYTKYVHFLSEIYVHRGPRPSGETNTKTGRNFSYEAKRHYNEGK